MQRIVLKQVEHDKTVGTSCTALEPNIVEDSLFVTEDGEVVGFYMRQIPPKMQQLASICNKEFRSKNVPKSMMKRSSGFIDGDASKEVLQYSTIIGSVPPKPHMRRPYATMSSVHRVKSAQTFIKAMLMLCLESENLIKEITPEIYKKQKQAIEENVPKKWRFGNLFTSSISNFNISADYHRDNANIKHCANVIITKRANSTGGNTTVPDYNATVESCDNSILVYPAWRNLHGVTPIVPTEHGGYRNSLVFYPLNSFKNC